MIFIVLSSHNTVHDTVHDTVQYHVLYFSLICYLLSVGLKRQNSLLSFVLYEREKVHYKCTMQCTVHFIITLFHVGNVLLCVI